jgi:hypothetical protein
MGSNENAAGRHDVPGRQMMLQSNMQRGVPGCVRETAVLLVEVLTDFRQVLPLDG